MILEIYVQDLVNFVRVKTGQTSSSRLGRSRKVAKSIQIMQIKHAVLTSVDRDDLKEDMGSKFWVATIKKIRIKSWNNLGGAHS